MIGGALLLAIGILTFAFAPDLWRPSVPAEPALGTAIVTAQQTPLLAAQNDQSEELMKLPKGTQVNLLGQIASLSEPFVSVQFVSGNKTSKPGFVRTTDLGSWTSPDAVSAWTFLLSTRPGENASEPELRAFLEGLESYRKKFSGTTQSAAASVEQAKVYLSAALRAKREGKPQAEWHLQVEKAKEALKGAGASQADEAARLTQRLEEIGKPEAPSAAVPAAATAAAAPDSAVKAYNTKAASCWHNGDLDCVLEQAELMKTMSPGQAAWWKEEVAKQRRALRTGTR